MAGFCTNFAAYFVFAVVAAAYSDTLEASTKQLSRFSIYECVFDSVSIIVLLSVGLASLNNYLWHLNCICCWALFCKRNVTDKAAVRVALGFKGQRRNYKRAL